LCENDLLHGTTCITQRNHMHRRHSHKKWRHAPRARAWAQHNLEIVITSRYSLAASARPVDPTQTR
jgi:hypothetical protein